MCGAFGPIALTNCAQVILLLLIIIAAVHIHGFIRENPLVRRDYFVEQDQGVHEKQITPALT